MLRVLQREGGWTQKFQGGVTPPRTTVSMLRYETSFVFLLVSKVCKFLDVRILIICIDETVLREQRIRPSRMILSHIYDATHEPRCALQIVQLYLQWLYA